MTHTDQQLKLALVKMLPEKMQIMQHHHFNEFTGKNEPLEEYVFLWGHNRSEMRDTELLHLCWLVEQGLHYVKQGEFSTTLAQRDEKTFVWDFDVVHASWQQRTIALAKVKGVEIV